MSAQLSREEIGHSWWNVNCCDGKFSGLSTAHCTACHETFTRPSGFDRHRRGGKCIDPRTMPEVYERANRPYPCWQAPGRES